MSYVYYKNPYNVDKAVFKNSSQLHASVSVLITRSAISRSPLGRYVIPAGVVLASVNGEDRPLPRDYVTAAATTSDTELFVTYPQLFKAGDTLYHQESTNTITIGGTWVAGNVITIQIGGYFLSFTVTQTTAAAVATELNTYINSHWITQNLNLRSGVSGAVVTLYTTGDVGTLTVSENSAAGTVAAGASTFNLTYPLIGTISYVDSDNSKLVLAAASAINVPDGAAIGPRVQHMYGLIASSIDLDDVRQSEILGAYEKGDIYRVGLVYWDNLLAARFPELNVYSGT